MILVDTSIWIDHLVHDDVWLRDLLNDGKILCHPFVLGELAMGFLPDRTTVLSDLRDLPQAMVATDDEVLEFVNGNRLFGLGIGYIDAHLLAAVRLTPDTRFWTRDKRLQGAAAKLSLNYAPKPN